MKKKKPKEIYFCMNSYKEKRNCKEFVENLGDLCDFHKNKNNNKKFFHSYKRKKKYTPIIFDCKNFEKSKQLLISSNDKVIYKSLCYYILKHINKKY